MVNENKVKMMTKMAIYEKHEGRRMIKTSKYFKGDFVALAVLKSLIATTFLYVILLIAFLLINMESLVSGIGELDYGYVVTIVVICYVIFLIVFGVISGIISLFQYEKSRDGLKRYFSRLNKLERFYNGQKKR